MKKSETLQQLATLTCVRCGYEWVPRTWLVKMCPNCKSRKWNSTGPKKSKGESK